MGCMVGRWANGAPSCEPPTSLSHDGSNMVTCYMWEMASLEGGER